MKNQQTSKSAVAEHLLDMGVNHWMELHNPKILSTDRNYHTRVIREAIEIKKYKNFNRENGFQLSSTWNPVIRKCKSRILPSKANPDTVSVVCRRSGFTDNTNSAQLVIENSRVLEDEPPRRSRRRRIPVPL